MKTEIIDPRRKAEWVAALRSGKYPQTQRRLRDDSGFCCLGVACDLADPEGWEENGLHRGSISMPRHAVKEWLGIQSWGSLMLTIHGETLCADEHNDRGRTFAEIADAIEEQL